MGKKSDYGNYLNNSMDVLFTILLSNLSCFKKELTSLWGRQWEWELGRASAELQYRKCPLSTVECMLVDWKPGPLIREGGNCRPQFGAFSDIGCFIVSSLHQLMLPIGP